MYACQAAVRSHRLCSTTAKITKPRGAALSKQCSSVLLKDTGCVHVVGAAHCPHAVWWRAVGSSPASVNTATDLTPTFLHARITRHAISALFATSTACWGWSAMLGNPFSVTSHPNVQGQCACRPALHYEQDSFPLCTLKQLSRPPTAPAAGVNSAPTEWCAQRNSHGSTTCLYPEPAAGVVSAIFF